MTTHRSSSSHFVRDICIQCFCQICYFIWILSPVLWFCVEKVICSSTVGDYWSADRISASHAIVISILFVHVAVWFLCNHFHYLKRVRYARSYRPREIWDTREGRERRGKIWYAVMIARLMQCGFFFYVFHVLTAYAEFWGKAYFLINMAPFFTDVIILCNEICG